MSFYTGYWPTTLAQSPAETERLWVIRVLESVVATVGGGALVVGQAPGSPGTKLRPLDLPRPFSTLLPRNRSVPTFEGLVSALTIMPTAYVRVKVDPAGLAFEKGTPNGSTGTFNASDPRRLTFSVVDGSARLSMLTTLKAQLTTDRAKYKVSIQGAGATIVLTHPDDAEV